MSLESGRSQIANSIDINNFNVLTSPSYGVVYEVILDVDSETAQNKSLSGAIPIGAIRFRGMGNTNVNYDEQLPIAFPLNKNIVSLPTKNEVVIIHNFGGNPHYSRIGGDLTPNINALTNVISSKFLPSESSNSENKSKEYQKVSQTNIPRANPSTSNSQFDGYGDYFQDQRNIHKLRLYEGDTLIESRFGQSIRFSAYNNSENEFYPNIIIRNGENSVSFQNEIGVSTEEDVNRDGSIISLTSADYQLPFQPGRVDDKGSTDFETKPDSFKNYPSDLKGDQLLLNSGRLIFSSKTAEMIFYSKGNYGFISDGELSIDNKFGIRANVRDNINITTNDKDVNINSGNGKINLGDQDLESLVRGETLVGLMQRIIDILIAPTNIVTTSGPGQLTPDNVTKLSTIRRELTTMLSDLNKTS